VSASIYKLGIKIIDEPIGDGADFLNDNFETIADLLEGGNQTDNTTAIIDPTANDDTAGGYSVGSLWINTITDEVFVCADSTTGSAVWVSITQSTSTVAEINDIGDVTISGIADNDILSYDSGSGDWINQTISSLDIATSTTLIAHTSDTSNPHAVTLEQARSENSQLSGDIDANSNTIENLRDPVVNQEAATKAYVDDAVLNTDASTKIDKLDPEYITPGNLAEIDTEGGIADSGIDAEDVADHIGDVTTNPHAVTLEQARTENSTLAGNVDMGSNYINNLSDPTLDQDAATKIYVDTEIADATVDITGKIDKLDIEYFTEGNIAEINSDGGIQDSGQSLDDFWLVSEIVIVKDDGTHVEYAAIADTDDARGDALLEAAAAAVAGDLILLGPGTFDLTSAATSLTLATDVDLTGLGRDVTSIISTTSSITQLVICNGNNIVKNITIHKETVTGTCINSTNATIENCAIEGAGSSEDTVVITSGNAVNLYNTNISTSGPILDIDAVSGSVTANIWNSTFNIYNIGGTVTTTYLDANNLVKSINQSIESIILGSELDANAQQINDLADPTLDQDAATKAYVDTKIASVPLAVEDNVATFDNSGNVQDSNLNINDVATIDDLDTKIDKLDPVYINPGNLAEITADGQIADSGLALPGNNGVNGEFLQTDGNGGTSWATAGGVIVGTDTQVVFFDGTDNPAGDAGLTYNKTTDALTVAGAISGSNLSGSNTGDQTITLTGDVTGSGTGSFAATIASGVIINDDINASAGIVDTKLATIGTAGKVSNSATTATDANTSSAIVARDGSGNFTAGTITAALTGNASTASAWVSARNLAGNSVDGSGDVAFANKFIVQGTTDTGLSAAQFLGSLTTGIVKNTTTTGILNIDALVTGLSDMGTGTGMVAQTGASSFSKRTIAAGSSGVLTVTNGDGVSGAPTISANVDNSNLILAGQVFS